MYRVYIYMCACVCLEGLEPWLHMIILWLQSHDPIGDHLHCELKWNTFGWSASSHLA